MNTASIVVTVTNNTGSGAITFNMLDFMQGDLEPGGYPPIIIPTLAKGATATILQSYCGQLTKDGINGPLEKDSPCSGTATFNLPDGQALTISWNLNAYKGGPTPIISVGSNYTITNLKPPTVSGYNYTFNIGISTILS